MQDERVVSLIRQGQEAAQRGDTALAEQYLSAAAELDPTNITALLWLSGVQSDLGAQRETLERVLTIDPNNVRAQQGLAEINRRSPVVEPAPVDEPFMRPASRGTGTLGGTGSLSGGTGMLGGTGSLSGGAGTLSIDQELRAALRDPAVSTVVVSGDDAVIVPRRTLVPEGDAIYRVAVAVLTLTLLLGFCFFVFAITR